VTEDIAAELNRGETPVSIAGFIDDHAH